MITPTRNATPTPQRGAAPLPQRPLRVLQTSRAPAQLSLLLRPCASR